MTLAAYFLSKYEMTQGQWHRFTGENPSRSAYGKHPCLTAWNPVEQVSWEDCTRALFRLGLVLPTEAQWEYGARGAMSTVWWCGNEKESIASTGAGNLAGAHLQRGWAPARLQGAEWHREWEDDRAVHAPVGSFAPNALGLHDVIGNVWEWCRDGYGSYDLPTAGGDGERQVQSPGLRVTRGGGFF